MRWLVDNFVSWNNPSFLHSCAVFNYSSSARLKIMFCPHDVWLQCPISLQDMIHIADTKVARRYGDFFIRQIHKFEEVSKLLKPLCLVLLPETSSHFRNSNRRMSTEPSSLYPTFCLLCKYVETKGQCQELVVSPTWCSCTVNKG